MNAAHRNWYPLTSLQEQNGARTLGLVKAPATSTWPYTLFSLDQQDECAGPILKMYQAGVARQRGLVNSSKHTSTQALNVEYSDRQAAEGCRPPQIDRMDA